MHGFLKITTPRTNRKQRSYIESDKVADNANVFFFCVFRTSLRILLDMLAALLVVCAIETI